MTTLHAPAASTRSADEWYRQGTDALRRRDLRSAEDAFGRAVLADRTHANALYRLGELAQKRDDHGEAVTWFERALRANPDHAGARDRLRALATTGTTPPSKAPHHPQGPPHAPRSGGIVGIVRSYQQRAEQNLNRRSVFVLSFRIEVPGHDGPPIPVEMRGPELHGSLANGDWVELPRGWRRGRPLKRLGNLTTDQTVRFRGRGSHRHPLSRLLMGILGALMVLWVLAIAGLAIAGIVGVDVPQVLDDFREALPAVSAALSGAR